MSDYQRRRLSRILRELGNGDLAAGIRIIARLHRELSRELEDQAASPCPIGITPDSGPTVISSS